MDGTDFNQDNDNPIVIEEPKDTSWAEVESYEIRRENGRTTVTIRGRLAAKNCRLLVYQSGPRRHFTYRILQQCNGAPGGDQTVPFTTTLRLSAIGGGATFVDASGKIDVSTNLGARVEGGDGPFPHIEDIDRPFPLGKESGASEVTVTGILTDEGVECRAMREEKSNQLYTLIPRQKLNGFRNGERVKVRGSIAQVSFCIQGTTLAVTSIERA